MRLPVAFAALFVALSGCSDGGPSPAASPGTAAETDGTGSARPEQGAGADDGPGAAPTPFQPVTMSWDGSSEAGACVISGGSSNCVAVPTGDCCERFDVPAGAQVLTVTVTWTDPAMRQLNVAVYGVSEGGLIQQGGSPLVVQAPISVGSTEAQVFVDQYAADAGTARVTTPVEFHVDVAYS